MRLLHWIQPFLLALSCVICIPAKAQTQTTHGDLYRQAGLNQQFEQLWQQVTSEYNSLPKNIPNAKINQTVHDAIESEFSSARIRAAILEHWQRQLDQEDVNAITDWLASSVGRKVTLAEINTALLEDDGQFYTYLRSLKKQPPSKTRLELLRALDKSLHNSDASTDMGININLAAVAAQFASGQAPEGSATLEQQTKSHERDRGLIRAMMRQDVLQYNLFTYRYIDNESLRNYLKFAQSGPGTRYHKSTFFAVREAMGQATLELQQQLQGQIQQVSHSSQ